MEEFQLEKPANYKETIYLDVRILFERLTVV